MIRSRHIGLVIFVLIALPTVALGVPLNRFVVRSQNGFLFDPQADSSMALINGLNDAYDMCYRLRVDGVEFRTPSVTVLFAGKGLGSPRTTVGSIDVSREIYVHEAGDWARYYDLVVNRSNKAQTVDVEIFGNLGSDSSTKLVSTSDGDSTLENSDTWFVTDDYVDGGGDPSLAHVFRRSKGRNRPRTATLQRDDISVRYQVKLRPRAGAAIVFFAVQTKNTTEAARIARELAAFGPVAKTNLSAAQIKRIIN